MSFLRAAEENKGLVSRRVPEACLKENPAFNKLDKVSSYNIIGLKDIKDIKEILIRFFFRVKSMDCFL